jgi:carbamoylphosphate synthase small subunit
MLANGEGDPHEIICNMAKAHLHLEQYQPVLGIVTKYSAQTQK